MTAETAATWRMALSVSVATGAYGVSFGALAVAAGLDVWQAMVLSLLMYTGGSQFAFVGTLASGGLPAAGLWDIAASERCALYVCFEYGGVELCGNIFTRGQLSA